MYSKYAKVQEARNGNKLKAHYHVRIDVEFHLDCEVWRTFLSNHRDLSVCRPMVDLTKTITAKQIMFYSDTSANKLLGFRAVFNNAYWLYAQLEDGYIDQFNPSIEYLELFAVTAALLTWGHMLQDQAIIIFCDNQAMVCMINNLASSCGNCMRFLRMITLNNLIHNRQVFVCYVRSEENDLSDSLSRLQFKRFWSLALWTMNPQPSMISALVWPASKIWDATI